MTVADLPVVLTVDEAASVLRISRGLAYEGVKRGEIPAIHIGGRIRVPRSGLLALLGEPAAEPESTSSEAA